jgi:hypothetical protein
VGKVLAEQSYLRQVASGRGVPFNAPMSVPRPAAPTVNGVEQTASASAAGNGSDVVALR